MGRERKSLESQNPSENRERPGAGPWPGLALTPGPGHGPGPGPWPWLGAGSVNQTSLTRLAEQWHYNAIIFAHENLAPKFGTWVF